ncbi:MAG TPA: hypothetical protein VFL99_00565 [Segeticoccus sp.]|uniref:hypothetical protein n=1 Tax=Segeticoccus sp. TaxID=2706531 RepID=UPI002D7F171C|nr:hypothetical protein [Segeticoccus sp.]HET8598786.1 hypothetical protein [Segeticoccus sp.]
MSNSDRTARDLTAGASVEEDLEEMIRADQAPEEWGEGDDHDVQLRALDDDTSRTDSLGPLEDLDSEEVGDDLDDEDWREGDSGEDERA